jgi:hypothetical protein
MAPWWNYRLSSNMFAQLAAKKTYRYFSKLQQHTSHGEVTTAQYMGSTKWECALFSQNLSRND